MPIKHGRAVALLSVVLFAALPGSALAQAQDPMPGMSGHDMGNMDMSGHDMNNAAPMDMPGMSQTGGMSGMS